MNGLAVCGIISGFIYFILFNLVPVYFILLFTGLYFTFSWVYTPSSSNKFNTIRRKIQICTWSDPVRPSLMGYIPLKISNALRFIDKVSTNIGCHVTITHLVSKVVGQVFSEFPDVNGKIAFGNFITYKTVDATLAVSMDEGVDLYYVPIKDITQKNVSTIAIEVRKNSESLRVGKDREVKEKSTKIFNYLPTYLISIVLEFSAFISSTLGIPIPLFNIKKHEFGSFLVTSVGMYNVEVGYPPLVPLFKAPALFCIASVHDEAVVADGKVVVEKILNICFNFDARFFDGMQAILMQNRIREIMEDPDKFLSVL